MKNPNFFLIGVPKAGTTSVHDVLSAQDKVFMSSLKEPHFFSRVGANGMANKNIRAEDEYYKLFDGANDGDVVVGESSTSYFYSKDALLRINELFPNAKVVAILRDPIDRLVSHWSMDFREGVQKKPLFHAVESDFSKKTKGYRVSHMYVECSLYSAGIKNAIDIFGRERFRFFLFEEVKENPALFYNELFRWLGISGEVKNVVHSNKAGHVGNVFIRKLFHWKLMRRFFSTVLDDKFKIWLRSKIMKPAEKVSLSVEDERILSEYFINDLRELQTYSGVDISRWKTSKYLEDC